MFRRGFHSGCAQLARTRYTKPKPKNTETRTKEHIRLPTQQTHHSNKLRITAPIPPSTANIVVPDDHPLWQFFADKKFMRRPEDLDTSSRPWTIPELRRKSFEDLHSLWYTCLKERNILARENHLVKNAAKSSRNDYEDISEKIRSTMWRIRHVLSERDWSFRRSRDVFDNSPELQTGFLQEFKQEFLAVDPSDDEHAFEMLTRFQEAVYGINEVIEDNVVDRKFVDGLKIVASLKLQRFESRSDKIKELISNVESENVISDVGEAFVVFTADNNITAIEEACDAIKELRDSDNKVSRYDELPTVRGYLKRLVAAAV
ncbi:Large ribosomal subunit protein uL29m [Nakaseomyces bracarensis]|uniref:Large ribosomal subunit protein uL29m n=1 Tax=Nakaseomyces bracarensis TaxID=273131 RepID=A0ABR4NT65_9SACH